MGTVLEKKGDNITRAINYIDEKLREQPETPPYRFISEAGAKFNLSPKDEEYLTNLFKRRQEESG